MYYKKKSKILFREYDTFGYITDNRNFGYKLLNNSENYIGDKILSKVGSYFISILDKKILSLNELTEKIRNKFPDIDSKILKQDAEEFYNKLVEEGFLVSGNSKEECNSRDTNFSYKNNKIEHIGSPNITSVSTNKSTQEFFEENLKGKPKLTNVHIEISSRCNERCIHCYIPHEQKINHIDPDLFNNIIEQCKNLNLLHITISGGEPMLHKEFYNFLKKCRESDFSVNILSNLTLLTDEIIEEMKLNPLLGVQTSLYSMNSEIHDYITQTEGSFEKTKNSILKLIKNDIPLQISCPIIKQNKDCYNDVVNWANNQGVYAGDDYIIIARYNHTTQNLNCRLSIKEIEDIIIEKSIKDTNYISNIKAEAEQNTNYNPDDYVCSVCESTLCIADNGNVYPCAGWQDYVVGNMRQNTLNEIWEKSEKVKYLRNLRKKDFPKCLKCPDKEYCTMCMVRNANEHPAGDPLVVNEYFCDIAKLNKKMALK
ncbi:radical SAM protein [Marinilabiliaceae bacterium JC040]|nr:radical SAM protein [Marinilabiliaceae bacterium JC040]